MPDRAGGLSLRHFVPPPFSREAKKLLRPSDTSSGRGGI
nr:MAG TPA: hypothetical protein [Caudoviricetes sp.]